MCINIIINNENINNVCVCNRSSNSNININNVVVMK